MSAPRGSRRELLAAAAGGLSVPVLGRLTAPGVAAAASADAELIASLVALERRAAVAHRALARRPRLSGPSRALLEQFRAHADAHARRLGATLARLGGTSPPAPSPSRIAGLSAARRGERPLRFALELELAAVAAYHDGLGQLRDARLLRDELEIMASHGQHLVALRRVLGEDVLPSAFERGRP